MINIADVDVNEIKLVSGGRAPHSYKKPKKYPPCPTKSISKDEFNMITLGWTDEERKTWAWERCHGISLCHTDVYMIDQNGEKHSSGDTCPGYKF